MTSSHAGLNCLQYGILFGAVLTYGEPQLITLQQTLQVLNILSLLKASWPLMEGQFDRHVICAL